MNEQIGNGNLCKSIFSDAFASLFQPFFFLEGVIIQVIRICTKFDVKAAPFWPSKCLLSVPHFRSKPVQ